MPFRELPGVTPCRFRKGERIIKAGDPVEYVYYLVKGSVNREMVTNKGYESIFSCKRTADLADSLIGILTLYNKTYNSVSRYDFIARTDCQCYRIPKEECKQYLRNHPALLEEVLSHAVREHANVVDLFLARREGSGTARLCMLLLERAKPDAEGKLTVSKKLTNIEIGKLLSIHKVTVSRMLRALREEGTIEKTEQGIVILNELRMKQYADNTQTLEYE